MKRVLVTGSTGMLGADVVRWFSALGSYEVHGLGRTTTSLLPAGRQHVTDFASSLGMRLEFVPDVIVHTAAITDLGLCQREPDLATRVNVNATAAVARLGSSNTKFIYISTDSVYDGHRGNYTEQDKTQPLNVYASTKLEGEAAAAKANAGETTVIRTNIYGFHIPVRGSLAEWAFREWSAGKTITGFTDVMFNAVYTGQLSEIIGWICERESNVNILHVGSDETISKYEFLDRLRRMWRIAPELLKAVSSDAVPSVLPRPRNTTLSTTLLSTMRPVPKFDDGIAQWTRQAQERGVMEQGHFRNK